jgi:hypothetical protein
MIPDLDLSAARLTLTFPDRASVRAFFAEATGQQAFLADLAEAPDPFTPLAVVVRDAGGFEFAFSACAVQVFPGDVGHRVVFQLSDWTVETDGRLGAKLAMAEEPAGGETFGVAPVFRIKQLDLAQKVALALKADSVERQILCRETAPMVLLNLLANPRLEAENVLAIVKSNFATADIFQRVAADRRWMNSAEIRTAVVRNPKTPTPIAVKLLETLPISELRDLAKLGNAKEDLRKAAFRVYTKLSGHRG